MMCFPVLRVARKFTSRQGEIADTLDTRLGSDERLNGAAMAPQNIMKCIGDIAQPMGATVEYERIVEAARSLHDRAAAADAAQYRDLPRSANRAVDFGMQSV